MSLLIRAAAVGQGAGFNDLRPALRAASVRDILHGARDFKHFNRKGMEALGQAVAARVSRPLEQDSWFASRELKRLAPGRLESDRQPLYVQGLDLAKCTDRSYVCLITDSGPVAGVGG